MKKTYIAPVQKMAELDMTAALLAGSDNHGLQSLNEQEGYTDEGYEGGYTKQQKTLWDELW